MMQLHQFGFEKSGCWFTGNGLSADSRYLYLMHQRSLKLLTKIAYHLNQIEKEAATGFRHNHSPRYRRIIFRVDEIREILLKEIEKKNNRIMSRGPKR